MDRFLVFLAGAGIGAAAGRWLNRIPASAMAWRPSVSVPERSAVSAVDVVVRTQSLLREIRALVVHAEVPDPVLEEKIRARIARMVKRPDAIQLRVEQGRVRLAGTARAGEIQALTDGLAVMRGVRDVENRVEALTPPFTSWDDAEPGSRAPRRKPGSYPPSVAMALAAGGMLCAFIGYRLRKVEGAALLGAGAAMLGAGSVGLVNPAAFGPAPVSHMSESSSWRPGFKGFRSTASP